MRIEFAHRQAPSTTGEIVDFAVFFAKANSDNDQARGTWLLQLKMAAIQAGRKVDAAALVYQDGNQTKWWGDPFAVDFINKNGIPPPNRWVEFS